LASAGFQKCRAPRKARHSHCTSERCDLATVSPSLQKKGENRMPNRAQEIFKPQFRFGLGGVSLGNEFNKHTDKEADATLEAAWEVGVRYFDVAPWYGFGLAERRFGRLLHGKKRSEYLLSSKVGKLFKASKNNRHAEIYPLSDSPNDIVYDYTADGVRRSIEDSLQRLGVDSLDIAFVHDISPDFAYFSERLGGAVRRIA
jgi:D-threo-aldose 1-dehydrogenase